MFLKKFKLFFLIVFILTIKTSAQEVTFKWAQLKSKDAEGLINPKVVLPSQNSFYTYSYENKSVFTFNLYVSKFDGNANFVKTEKILLPQRNRSEATLMSVFESMDNKSLFFISELALNKDNSNILYLQKFNSDTEKLESEIELEKITIEKLSNSGSFSVCQSNDKSKIGVVVHYPQIKDSNEKIKSIVYDSQFNKLWEKEYTLNHPSEKGYNEQLFISNDGQLIITKIIDEFKKEPKIISFNITNNDIKENLISELEFYPLNYKIIENESNEILLSGYFTDNWKPAISLGGRKPKGVFTHNLSQSKTTHKSIWSDAVQKDFSANFVDLSIVELKIINKEIYIIGDIKSKKEEIDKASAKFESNFIFKSGPGVIAKISSDNKQIASVFDYHKMEYMNRMGNIISFQPIQFKNELYLLGNDSEAQLKGKKLIVGSEIYYKTVVFNKFGSNGEISINPIWESGTGSKPGITILAPTYSRKINENMYYVYALGNEYQCFGIMTIK